MLIHKGANVNAEGGIYGYALSAALYGGHKEEVRLLLENEADIDDTGKVSTVLSAASYKGYEEAVNLLLKKGADANA